MSNEHSNQIPFPMLFMEPMEVFSIDSQSNEINSMGGTTTHSETATGGHGDTDSDSDTD